MCVTRGAWGRRFAGALAVRAWRVLALAALITVVEVLVSFPFVSTVTGRLFASRCGAVRVAPEGVPPRVKGAMSDSFKCYSAAWYRDHLLEEGVVDEIRFGPYPERGAPARGLSSCLCMGPGHVSEVGVDS